MSAERAQGRGWVRIPASRGEQSATARTAGHERPPYAAPYASPYASPYATASAADQPTIYLSVVKRWREAGRTLPGHPDEEWERLISQPCWPGR
ncbi:hypothetical protein ADK53_10785 [Streptomyces sp. WM6373]|uniref:hypothetical protein n=1 Tax=unclassified Streptomyces TaxID=2593676 RepID=UPI0006ADF9FC|nr:MULTISPECIES: hypothetical protein [unclassified Streptomyces]KOU39521.1 hypothetical protein ADK53_10785 [Streptomyces sp. WM6373]KOU71659.1 hypothetical protein ADK61_29765 [Streptomyces sp. XY66]KOU83071.1 hypothetical protein ADK93_27735 [Streptomyces sp. XY58]KOV03531.1 hypothetical protein ADK89_26975 [Streptomyces sp. XY37]KOV27452.1 hypothetical protein ADK90_01330 [Streptomyces sp. XY413]